MEKRKEKEKMEEDSMKRGWREGEGKEGLR